MSSNPPFVLHQPKHTTQHAPVHPQLSRRLPVIPDLRFEPSYIRSIMGHVHVRRPPVGARDVEADSDEHFDGHAYEKVVGAGKGKEAAAAPSRATKQVALAPAPSWDIERVDWGSIVWITVRDQVLSPLLQGVAWGVASHFLTPMLKLIGLHTRMFFSSRLPPPGEGLGVGWLRSWSKGLGYDADPQRR